MASGLAKGGWTADHGRPPAVRAVGLEKNFGGVRALDGLDITVDAASIHAVVGENGAGKSTLMNVLAGSVTPDSGELLIHGKPLITGSIAASKAAGIGIMHQELRLFPDRSVLSNLFAGVEPSRRGLVDTRAMRSRALPVLDRIGLLCDLNSLVGSLSLSDQQLVELARVLIEDPRVVILDEPTSALNARESERLANVLRDLPSQGTTVLYVSHRLQEVFAICNEISVVRDGRLVESGPTAEMSIASVVKAMIGGSNLAAPRKASQRSASETVALRVSGLATYGQLHDATLDAAAGEIVGVAGLVGSGAEELLLALFGAVPCRSGESVYPDGGSRPSTPTAAARRGIALVPADRKRVGVMLDQSIADNVSQVSVGAIGSGSFMVSRKRLAERGRVGIRSLAIKATGPEVPVRQLSGGNQQKVVLAKWLEIEPSLMLLDDPTRGVDIGAKMEIFRIMRDLADRGTTIIFRSTEISELTTICDRIYVIRDGVITDVVAGVDEEELLAIVNRGQTKEQDHER